MTDLLATVRADPAFAHYLNGLERHVRNSIRLHVRRPEGTLPLGASKIGGYPDVPDGFIWPRRHVDMARPSARFLDSHPHVRRLPADGMVALEFIAQVNLADAAAFDLDHVLPTDGSLLFFFDDALFEADVEPGIADSSHVIDGVTWYTRLFGHDEYDKVSVVHVPGGAALHRDMSAPRTYGALAFGFSSEPTLPSVDAYAIGTEPLDEAERAGRVVLPPDIWSRYAELEYATRANANIDHMLGWADNFSAGPSLPPAIRPAWHDMPHDERLAVTADARPLLQLSLATCERTGMRFGRDLYFYVRESELRNGDWSGAWYDMD
jgi:hypothetical protein